MPHSAFANPIRLDNGELVVTGPVIPATSTRVRQVDPVTIRLMIVQEPDEQQEAVIIEELTSWNAAAGDNFEVLIPATRAEGIQAGREVRLIGVAIIRWDPIRGDEGSGEDPDPPAFETYTWCVTRTVVAAQVAESAA
jgi:hypothetical protein